MLAAKTLPSYISSFSTSSKVCILLLLLPLLRLSFCFSLFQRTTLRFKVPSPCKILPGFPTVCLSVLPLFSSLSLSVYPDKMRKFKAVYCEKKGPMSSVSSFSPSIFYPSLKLIFSLHCFFYFLFFGNLLFFPSLFFLSVTLSVCRSASDDGWWRMSMLIAVVEEVVVVVVVGGLLIYFLSLPARFFFFSLSTPASFHFFLFLLNIHPRDLLLFLS